MDHRDAPDEVHRCDDGREAGGEPGVAPVLLASEHVGDHLALDGRLEAPFQVIAGALGLEEVLLGLEARLGDLLPDLVQVLFGEVVQDASDVLHHLLAVGEAFVRPRQRLPHLVTGCERRFHVLLARGGHVEELDAAVGGARHLGVLARGGSAPFARDEVADHDLLRIAGLLGDALLRVAEEVLAESLDVRLGHLPREQAERGAAVGVAGGERIGPELPFFVERSDGGAELVVYERHRGLSVTGRSS